MAINKFIIKPNIELTEQQIQNEGSFSSPLFGKINAIKQELIAKYSKPIKQKIKVRLKLK